MVAELVNLHAQPNLQTVFVRPGTLLSPLENHHALPILQILTVDPTIKDRVTIASKMHDEESFQEEIAAYKADSGRICRVITEEDVCKGLISFWCSNRGIGQPADPYKFGFGYFISPDARGKGLATNSARALMIAAQRSFRVDGFIAFCEDDNQTSIAVLAKLGLLPTDALYDEPNNGWQERLYEKVTYGED